MMAGGINRDKPGLYTTTIITKHLDKDKDSCPETQHKHGKKYIS